MFGLWTWKKEQSQNENHQRNLYIFHENLLFMSNQFKAMTLFNDPNLTYTAYIKCFVMLKILSNISAIDVCVVRIRQKFEQTQWWTGCRVDIPGLNLHRTHSALYDGKEETCFVSEPSCIEDTMSKIVIPRLQIVTGRIDTLESQTHHIRPILLLQCHWHRLYNTARRMLSRSLTKFHYFQPENDTDCLHLHQPRQTVGSSTCL